MEVVVERCAFLDVNRDTVVACARTPDRGGGRREEVASFGTTTSQLLELAAQYAQIRGRRGPQRAAVAVGHSILVIAWHLLTNGEPYTDLGGDYFDRRRNSQARQRRLISQLEALGHKVTLEPAA